MNDYGTVMSSDTVRLERLLPGPIERVWEYLTESDKRGKWFATGAMELRIGGSVEFKFHHADLSGEKEIPERFREKCAGDLTMRGVITACEPPRLLGFTFGDTGEVMFELTPEGDEVSLVLTHRRLPNRKSMVGVSAGWHSHLGILADVLKGDEPRPFWTTVTTVEAEYEKRIPAARG